MNIIKAKSSILFMFMLLVFSPYLYVYAKKSYSVFSPLIGYSLANTLKVDGSIGSWKYNENMSTSGTTILGVEGAMVYPINDKYYWGIALTASYEMQRKLGIKYNRNKESKFVILNIDFNGRLYSDEGFYFSGGFGFPQLSNNENFFNRNGKIAWIGGLGWRFSEMLVFEVQYRSYSFFAETKTAIADTQISPENIEAHMKQDESLSGFSIFIKIPIITI